MSEETQRSRLLATADPAGMRSLAAAGIEVSAVTVQMDASRSANAETMVIEEP